jgi:hypothetical protein
MPLNLSKQKNTILALGPLTDIGCLIQTYPQLSHKINCGYHPIFPAIINYQFV